MPDPTFPSDNESTVTNTSAQTRPICGINEFRFLPGTLLSQRYRIVDFLGRGGMGAVYRADDLLLGTTVALKFLPGTLHNQSTLERFRNEVRIARQVSHPNVCRVYDIGEAGGLVFLSMEFVEGEDLASVLGRVGKLSPGQALDIARKLCSGLTAAHERGVIHRDLKPANVMLDRQGQVRIMDFGLAAIADVANPGEPSCGTPGYISPEQFAGQPATQSSDIYAFGILLFEIIAGCRPFHATNLAALIEEQQSDPPNLASLVDNVHPAVDRIVSRCLDPDPRKRPPSALAVSAALPGGGDTPARWMVKRFAFEGSPAPDHRIALLLVGMGAVTIFATYWLTRPVASPEPTKVAIPSPVVPRLPPPQRSAVPPLRPSPVENRPPATFRLVRSMVGPFGHVGESGFVLPEPRNRFNFPADQTVTVYFEWQGPSGQHLLTANWKQPDGQVASTSPDVSAASIDSRLSCYWEFKLLFNMRPGIWVVEILIDGQSAASQWFEVSGTRPPPG
jgi:serine/threonine protein kinase